MSTELVAPASKHNLNHTAKANTTAVDTTPIGSASKNFSRQAYNCIQKWRHSRMVHYKDIKEQGLKYSVTTQSTSRGTGLSRSTRGVLADTLRFARLC